LRWGVPTYGKWIAIALSSQNKNLLYVPAGFAHGFSVVSDEAEVLYMTSEEYDPSLESGVLWNDPDLNIAWPIAKPLLSDRDRAWPRLKDADDHRR
jgi:dTDP-4-dehydrorhamnose 3,5-epimerase